jgi:apolipoprotein N-acyltransferase
LSGRLSVHITGRPARWLDLAAVAFAGGLHSVAVAHTEAWWLQLLAVAWLARRVASVSPKRAAALGLCFGWAWLASSLWWLFVSMHLYGGLPAWMAAAAVALLSVFLASYLALAMAGFARTRRGLPLPDLVLFAAWWLLAELVRARLFTGLPWAASGYAHVDSPLAALAPWLGVYGIGFVAAALAAALGLPRSAGARAWALSAAAAALFLLLAGAIGPGAFSRPSGALTLTLLQGNVPQDEKFSIAHLPESLEWTRRELLAADADLVLGPETVIPLLPDQLDP